MSQTARERLRQIGREISDAMMRLPDINWSRESADIAETFDVMQEMMARYSERNASREDVRVAYKSWVNAHRGGLF